MTISEDCNVSSISIDYKELNNYNYTKKDICTYLNKMFGTEFEDIEVLDKRFSKFDCDQCCGDEFEPNYEEIAQARKIYNYLYDYEKNVLGKEYPNCSAYFDGNVFMLLVHYNCYNHLVEIPDVFKYDFNYQPPEQKVLDLAVGQYMTKYK